MKRLVALLISSVMVFCMAACGTETQQDNGSKAEKYKQVAQQSIDSGDVENAKAVLREGISVTNDEELKKMLEELENKDAKENTDDETAKENAEGKVAEDNGQEKQMIAGVYAPEDGSDGCSLTVLNYTESEIEFAVVATESGNTVGMYGECTVSDGKCEFFFKDSMRNKGTGTLTLEDDGLYLEFNTTRYVGSTCIDIAEGKYVRCGDVTSDEEEIRTSCDGGIVSSDGIDDLGETTPEKNAYGMEYNNAGVAQSGESNKKRAFTEQAARIEAYAETYLDTATTQYDMNNESAAVYKMWDDLLNKVYKHLKETMPEGDFNGLEMDEIAWIKQKEEAVANSGAYAAGGTLQILEENLTALEYTKERCYYLISLVN